MKRNSAIVVLGMHRSGTSAVTGVLNQLGVPLGKNLYPAQRGVNEKGFWENGTIVELDDEVLFSLGSCWDDWLEFDDEWMASPLVRRCENKIIKALKKDFSGKKIWAVKDPRMCRLIPLWKKVLSQVNTQPFYLLMIRHPSQVVKSLVKRDGFSLEKSLLLWLRHNLEMERETRAENRMVTSFDGLLNDPYLFIDKLAEESGFELPIHPSNAKEGIDDFLSGSLAHHRSVSFSEHTELTTLAERTAAALECLGKGEGVESTYRELDDIYKQFNAYISGHQSVLIEQIRYLGRERGKYQTIWENLSQLWSWRLLGPLRIIEKWLRNIG